MKSIIPHALAATALVLAMSAAGSETRVVTLDVKGMDCGTCPLTVKVLLKKQEGVREVTVDRKSALVRYEPSKVDEERLVNVVSEAGYPAVVRK